MTTIKLLTIERFRGVKSFSWYPAAGLNLILGGGDAGKSTVLDAIGLLVSPTNSLVLSDSDFYDREVDKGFVIEAVVTLSQSGGVNDQTKHLWPWGWDGVQAVIPVVGSSENIKEPVYRIRVRGTPDLELTYEVIQPDETAEAFSVSLRRSIGLVRLSSDDRNDRDLRLVQGSALDRLLSDRGLRPRLTHELSKSKVRDQLNSEAIAALESLDTAFQKKNLPAKLGLAITGSQGFSVAAMIGLTSERRDIPLPMSSWGSGTRRLATLTIAELNQGDSPITIVDEIERGLEPYRQRILVKSLQENPSQVFVTTHSSTVISAASKAAIWYLGKNHLIGSLNSASIQRHRRHDPEMFLSSLTVVAEGATECGLVAYLLEKALGSDLEMFGVHVADGCGHESALSLLEQLSVAGLRFGGFADNEGKYPERWKKVANSLQELLFRWEFGSTEKNVLSLVPEDRLEELVADPANLKTGSRLRSIADRLGTGEKEFRILRDIGGTNFRPTIIEAALGTVPKDKLLEKKKYEAHSQIWFKTVEGGRELGAKIFDLGIWPKLKPQLSLFCSAVRLAIGLERVPDGTGE